MTPSEFVENIRQEIREEGFMSAVQLAAVVVNRAREFSVNANPIEVIGQIPCADIHHVEYANWLTKDYRRKDLYYFHPGKEVDIRFEVDSPKLNR